MVSLTGAATFTTTTKPLFVVGSGPFTIVAVWRVQSDAAGGGGHPFNVNELGLFHPGAWTEGIAVETDRTVRPTPGEAGVVANHGG